MMAARESRCPFPLCISNYVSFCFGDTRPFHTSLWNPFGLEMTFSPLLLMLHELDE